MIRLIKPLKTMWGSLGIVPKIIIPQFVIILVLLSFSIPLVYQISYFNTSTDAAINSYNFATLSISRMETQLRQIRSAANYLAGNPLIIRLLTGHDSPQEFQALHTTVQNTLINYEYNRGTVHEIRLYATEQASLAAQTALPLWTPQENEVDIAEYTNTGNRWEFVSQENDGSASRLVLKRHLYHNGQHVGTLHVESTINLVTELTDFFQNIICCEFLLLDDHQNIFLQSEGMTQEIKELCLRHLDAPEGYLMEKHSIFYSLHFSELQMMIIAMQQPQISFAIHSSDTATLIFAIIFLVICILLSVGLYLTITRRIIRLSDHMMQINDLSQLQLMPVNGSDEIATLTHSYNTMLQRIQDYAKDAQNAEILQRKAEYDTLQAQIQPHFLYNTLETLRMLADENDDEQVADMLYLLGRLLRNTISPRSHETCIQQELENVKDYLTLYQLRMPTLSYSIESEPETLDIHCPCFIIQPLVENAIKHGLRRSLEPGFLRVTTYVRDSFLYVDVFNSGDRMSEERIQEINQKIKQGISLNMGQGISTGLGLNNVHSRLQFYFGTQSGVSFEHNEQGKTICRLTMQLM